jgi:hypothetical protein
MGTPIDGSRSWTRAPSAEVTLPALEADDGTPLAAVGEAPEIADAVPANGPTSAPTVSAVTPTLRSSSGFPNIATSYRIPR